MAPRNPLCFGHVGRICPEVRERRSPREQLDRQPVGTGPYQLSEYRAGQYIRLQRHDDFWRGKPLMPQVVVDLGSGGTGRLSKLLTGGVRRSGLGLLPVSYPFLRDDPRLRLTLRPGMNVAYLAFNTAKPPLNNPRCPPCAGTGD